MATFIVDSLTDENDGNTTAGHLSLREAIALANGDATADTINFSGGLANSTVLLTLGQLTLTQDVNINGDINGDGKADIAISGNNANRVLGITGGTTDVNLANLTLANGSATTSGGGIYATGIGSLTLTNSTISNNQAAFMGGGVFVSGGTVNVVNSLVNANTSQYHGGGLYFFGSNATLTNTTVNGNAANADAGGIAASTGTVLTLLNSTITHNFADANGNLHNRGGGIENYNSTLNILNSIVSGNQSGTPVNYSYFYSYFDDVNGDVNTANHSFFGTNITILNNIASIVNGGDAHLGRLLDNGGAVLTRSPLDGSPLIGVGKNALLPPDTFDVDHDGDTAETLPFDARGVVRIIGGTVDIGAVEQKVNETIHGTDGADLIFGGLGKDSLFGLSGADILNGGAGADKMNGGGGKDTLDYDGSAAGVSVDLGAGTASGGDATGDVFSGFENLAGSGQNDILVGSAGTNRISGGNGSDRLFGGPGADRLTGGKGADFFILQFATDSPPGTGHDLFMDFSHTQGDIIDFSPIDAVAGGSDDPFHFTAGGGTGAFTGMAGELRFFQTAKQTIIQGDIDGNGLADVEAAINKLVSLLSADFDF